MRTMKTTFSYAALIFTAIGIGMLNINYILGDGGAGYLGTSIAVAFLLILAQQTIIFMSNMKTPLNNSLYFATFLLQLAVLWTYANALSKLLAFSVVVVQLARLYATIRWSRSR